MVFVPALYAIYAAPVIALWKFIFLWNTALLDAYRDATTSIANTSTGAFASGVRVTRLACRRLAFRTYLWLAAYLILVTIYSLAVLYEDIVTPMHVHMWGVVVNVGVSLIIAALSGSMIFVSPARTPRTLRRYCAVLCVALWIFIWEISPPEVFNYARPAFPTRDEKLWALPIGLTTLPMFAALLLLGSLYWLGSKLRSPSLSAKRRL